MYVNVKVNEKGQIVIPKGFREAYGIEPGSEVRLGEQDNKLIIVKKMTSKEWGAFLDSFPKHGKIKIDSDKDYAEELDNR